MFFLFLKTIVMKAVSYLLISEYKLISASVETNESCYHPDKTKKTMQKRQSNKTERNSIKFFEKGESKSMHLKTYIFSIVLLFCTPIM